MIGIERTKEWFELAVPNPLPKNVNTQLGVHFEEVAEMLDEMEGTDAITDGLITQAARALKALATRLKTEVVVIDILNRKELLDAITDQIVTTVGSAHMYNMDIVSALHEVNRSNFSKFVNDKPIFDENMKIKKGPNYFKPDLSKYV